MPLLETPTLVGREVRLRPMSLDDVAALAEAEWPALKERLARRLAGD